MLLNGALSRNIKLIAIFDPLENQPKASFVSNQIDTVQPLHKNQATVDLDILNLHHRIRLRKTFEITIHTIFIDFSTNT